MVKSSPTGSSENAGMGSAAGGCSCCRASCTSGGKSCWTCDRTRAALLNAPSLTARKAARRTDVGKRSGCSAVVVTRPFGRGFMESTWTYSATSVASWPAAYRPMRPFTTEAACFACRRPPRPTGWSAIRQKAASRRAASLEQVRDTPSSSSAS